MKQYFYSSLLVGALFLSPCLNEASSEEVILVPGRYDEMGLCLDKLELEHVALDLEELISTKSLSESRAIFLPSGSLPSLEGNIRVLTRPRNMGQVVIKLKHEVEEERLFSFLRDYVKGGGSVYLSGFAYLSLQDDGGPFIFEKSFPARGMAGFVDLEFLEGFPGIKGEKDTRIFVPYDGWIAPAMVKESRVLVRGKYPTVLGMRDGPLMVCLERGKGAWYYSSLPCDAPGTSFLILQAAGRKIRLSREERLHLEGYRVIRHFTDRVTSPQGYRSYPVNGSDDIRSFVTLEKGFLEWEIRDREGRIVSAGREGPGISLLPSCEKKGTLYLYRLSDNDPGLITTGMVQRDPGLIYWALAPILLLGFSTAGVLIFSRS